MLLSEHKIKLFRSSVEIHEFLSLELPLRGYALIHRRFSVSCFI